MTPDILIEQRPDSSDWMAYDHVFKHDDYRTPKYFLPSDVVFDVGAHIGCFTVKALALGAGHVYAWEPDQDNFLHLVKNAYQLPHWQDKVTLSRKAMWCNNTDTMTFSGYPEGVTVVGSIMAAPDGHDEKQPVDVEAFDEAVERARKEQHVHRLRFLKMDCEGAEWPIFMKCKGLREFDEIAIEVHEYPESEHCTIEKLRAAIARNRLDLSGYDTEICRAPSWEKDVDGCARVWMLYARDKR